MGPSCVRQSRSSAAAALGNAGNAMEHTRSWHADDWGAVRRVQPATPAVVQPLRCRLHSTYPVCMGQVPVEGFQAAFRGASGVA